MDIKKYKKQIWYLIPGVSLLISVIYLVGSWYLPISVKAQSILSNIILTSLLWLGCLIIVNTLWKKFPWQIHPVKHLFIEIAAIIFYTNFILIGLFKITSKLIFPEFEYTTEDVFKNFLEVNLITMLITIIHEAIYFYNQWKTHFSKSVKLEKDNIQAKYNALKTQINPHFLFNSLNSLVELVNENDEAVKYIDNLSDFLRYMLKSREKELVFLNQEIEIAYRYINLQKTRFKDKLCVSINIDKEYLKYSVPPLVIQMLLENCIKHNIISKNEPLNIAIFTINESIIVENNLQLKSNVESTGQGLKNIEERYGLFTTKEVVISNNNQKFRVIIPLLKVEE